MSTTGSPKSEKKSLLSETSDCGYGTLIETHEFIAPSRDAKKLPSKKPVRQKLHNPMQRVNNNKVRASVTIQDRKRKKIVKRGKFNM